MFNSLLCSFCFNYCFSSFFFLLFCYFAFFLSVVVAVPESSLSFAVRCPIMYLSHESHECLQANLAERVTKSPQVVRRKHGRSYR